MTRDEILERMWAQDREHMFITEADYLRSWDGWTLTPHDSHGETVGAVMTKGPDIHFVTFGGKWSLTRGDIRHYLQPLIRDFGYALTQTPLEDERQQRFNKLIGFVECGQDEFFLHFRIETLRGGAPCQQSQ